MYASCAGGGEGATPTSADSMEEVPLQGLGVVGVAARAWGGHGLATGLMWFNGEFTWHHAQGKVV